MEITHRTATPEEEFIRHLFAELVIGTLGAMDWPEALRAPLVESQFRMGDGAPAGRVAVARLESEIRLIDIAVLSAFRGKGIATARIRELLEEGDQAAKPVRLRVDATNPALRLYERLGFRQTGADVLGITMERR